MSINHSAMSGVGGHMEDIFLVFYIMKVCCVFSLESHHWSDSDEYTQYIIFNVKEKITLKYPKSEAMGLCFQRTNSKQPW